MQNNTNLKKLPTVTAAPLAFNKVAI